MFFGKRFLCRVPNNWKHRGKVVERRRQARKPKCRIRTKPFGRICKQEATQEFVV